ncbi:MAG: epoxyqueuosine reductase QueH [Clostridia bacterium]|nr:epoxyqueuosine reductase QueH [Clostridia bacterium]MDD4146159.1 epoxyqueuosine reductase QueH [Clostridia bacterium]MDD4665594.1 epoxyqueuosine reductase QueH [Clostridia bacterium]
MKILLHVCCGPCSIYPVETLRQAGHEIRGYFYNPNIHPYTEFTKRLETFTNYAQKIELPVILDEQYALEEFLRSVVFREGERCRICYSSRLKKAAQIAKQGKFDAFTTTLLVSPFQKHELIKEIASSIAIETEVPFYYEDFRAGFKEGVLKSKEEKMYRQQYCGCIFSEKERYYSRKRAKRNSVGGC